MTPAIATPIIAPGAFNGELTCRPPEPMTCPVTETDVVVEDEGVLLAFADSVDADLAAVAAIDN